MKIRKNDNVLVIAGKDRGKTGKVRFVFPKNNTVIVEGINMIKKTSKANEQQGKPGIIEREAPMSASNVMLLCKRCNKPARIGDRVLKDGTTVRFCRVCNEVID